VTGAAAVGHLVGALDRVLSRSSVPVPGQSGRLRLRWKLVFPRDRCLRVPDQASRPRWFAPGGESGERLTRLPS